ncbi:MAG TPA: S9 family peptidase [Bacteroidales bacterium]|nr:S9 family peptidase [Bacteroidales bacterium]
MKKILSIIVIGLIVINIVAQEGQKSFTLENILQSTVFQSEGIYGLSSMNDGQHYSSLKGGDILMYEYKSGKLTDTLVKGSELVLEDSGENIRIRSYTFSDDESKILIPAETESIYRWSTKSNYYIWDLKSKKITPLSVNGKQRLADFSPDGNRVCFVRENNIFIKDLTSGDEIQITDDGIDRKIINGTTDWVYEEEFGFTKGFFWSPDGSKIAYFRFDESGVPEYEMQMWGNLYPDMHRYKYPKAGEENSIVSIHIYDLATGKKITAEIGQETDQYIPRIKWTKNPGFLSVQRLNRLQNHLEILIVDAGSGKSRVIYDETNKYYIDITDHLTFTDEQHFLISSEADGFNHIYYYHIDEGLVRQLTKGNWDVTDIAGFDPKRKTVFFQAAMSSPINRELCSVSLKGEINLISEREGTNSAEFSTNFDYFINTFSDANTPPVITVNKYNGKEVRMIVDNKTLKDTLDAYGYSKREFFKIITDENVELNAWRILPPGFDPAIEYPLLMYVYGGPGSQTVQNSWEGGNLWYQMLAQQGFICISVDNRGTGARGEEFKKMTYLQLGKYETIDQIAAATKLAAEPWVDEDRIGIFGWSYGGFMSTLCMTKGADIFDLGIAVAPVSNWKYYDNIYTERFMRTPQENPGGYEDNSPINFTDGLNGKFMLVHGTGDDNVHVQNSIDLISALVESDKQFELMLYPNKNHGIYGGNTRNHLFRMMTEFLLENLK